jgi:hypothetical protein
MTPKDKNPWVDFKAIKQNVSFLSLLERYG